MIAFYIIMGLLFTYLAINSGDQIWSFRTLLPTAIATFDFGVAIRLITIRFFTKQDNTKK